MELSQDAITERLENWPIARLASKGGDGEENSTDACPGTPLFEPVDGNGCSLFQYCTSIPTPTKTDERACKGSDWRNDEPLGRAGDCQVDKATSLCVPL